METPLHTCVWLRRPFLLRHNTHATHHGVSLSKYVEKKIYKIINIHVSSLLCINIPQSCPPSMDSQPRKDRFRAKRQPVVDIERNACAFRFPPSPLLSHHADSRAHHYHRTGNCIHRNYISSAVTANSRTIRGYR